MLAPKVLQPLILLILAFVTCITLIWLSVPADAKAKNTEQMLHKDILDRVNLPPSLDLEYLHQTPPPLDIALMENVRLADSKAAQLPENGFVGIPLGSTGPIPVKRELPALSYTLEEPGRFWAVGSGNRNDGTTSPLYIRDVREMFTVEERIGGFGGISQNPQEQWIADAQGNYLEARRPIVHDILIFDSFNEEVFVERNVYMSTICRETINAFLTDSYDYRR